MLQKLFAKKIEAELYEKYQALNAQLEENTRELRESNMKRAEVLKDKEQELDKLIKSYEMKITELGAEEQKLNECNIYEYYDYILCCDKMMLNMRDKEVLFPKNFREEHDKITSEMIIATDLKINERISSLSKLFALNIYEDDKYIIFPASSVDSLIDESSQMSNCVRNYCIKLSNNECQIYFMRYKNNVNKSLVTIEVRDGKIVQARTRFNEFPTDEMNEIPRMYNMNFSITLIDIDHDAGNYAHDGGDYIKLLDWLEETGRNYPIHIHSMNVVGVENMRRIIQRNGWNEIQ